MSDLYLKQTKYIRFRLSKMEIADRGTTKYLDATKNDPSLHRAVEESPEFGFLKLRRLFTNEPMARVKYVHVFENIEEKQTMKDIILFSILLALFLILCRTIMISSSTGKAEI